MKIKIRGQFVNFKFFEGSIYNFKKCNQNINDIVILLVILVNNQNIKFPSFSNSITKSTHIFVDLFNANIWGPYTTLFISFISGHQYFLILVDYRSRFPWIIHLKIKSETRQQIINFFFR